MGWTVCNEPIGCSAEQHLISLYTVRNGRYGSRVKDIARDGSTFYVLLRVKEEGRPVYQSCAVVLTQGSPNRPGFGWKTMDEMMGPAESRCPASILSQLSPVENLPYAGGCAQQWRDQCWSNARDVAWTACR